MTSSNPNSPTNSPLNFRPFALTKGRKFKFLPANSVGLAKPVITQALQTGGDAIQVTWGESGGTSYALQVSTNGGTTFSDVTTAASTSFTHTGLSFPGSYTYRVRATVDAEVSDWSDNVTETMVDVPAAPGGLTVTGATTSSISLSWNDTADEGSYLVEVSVDGLGSWTSAGSTNQNVVTFTHSGLAESVQRHYRVTAVNKAGGSIPSSTANSWTVPAAPTGLTATVASSTQINLAWTDVSTGNQSYKVERSTDNVNWTEIATGLSATATTYSATGLTASTLYYFRVRAANAARNSSYSGTATATTTSSTTVPNAPSDLTPTATFADSVSLSWTDESSGTGQETGFDIEVSTNAGSTYSSVATTAANATSYTHTGRVESTTYLYRIRATNSAGSSSWVSGGNVTTPAAITGFTATAASSSQINLAWTDRSGVETGFRIEQSTDNTNWSLVTTTAANATSFSNTGLTASTLYYYRIRSNSYNGTNDSAWYSASATTQAAAGVPNPTFEVNFTTDPYVGTRFNRASRGTFVNSSGFIQAAEMNIALQSQTINTTATWIRVEATAVADAATAPDGTATAERLREEATTGRQIVYHTAMTTSTTSPWTFSIYVKKDTRDYFVMQMNFSSDRYSAIFNVANGTVESTLSSGAITNSSASIVNVGNGWYRCIITAQGAAGGSSFPQIGLSDRATFTGTLVSDIPSYTGNQSNAVFVWGAQIVQGSSALPYSRTTTGSNGTPRITHDPVTLAPLGLLLEAQATNYALYSQDFTNTTSWPTSYVTVTANSGTSPDGTNNAFLITEVGASSGHFIGGNNINSMPTTALTASVYVKKPASGGCDHAAVQMFFNGTPNTTGWGIVNLTTGAITATSAGGFTNFSATAVDAGNGWWRLSITGTPAAGGSIGRIWVGPSSSTNPVYNVSISGPFTSILAWGAQFENAAATTSYIPTTTATVTRSTDTFALFSSDLSFWNASAGSVAMDWRFRGAASSSPDVFAAGNTGTNTQKMTLGAFWSNLSPYIVNTASSTSTVTGFTGAAVIGTSYKSGFAYDNAPNFKGFVNGVAGLNITARAIPTVARWAFGYTAISNLNTFYDGTNAAMTVSRIRYWNTKLSDADMQTATT